MPSSSSSAPYPSREAALQGAERAQAGTPEETVEHALKSQNPRALLLAAFPRLPERVRAEGTERLLRILHRPTAISTPTDAYERTLAPALAVVLKPRLHGAPILRVSGGYRPVATATTPQRARPLLRPR